MQYSEIERFKDLLLSRGQRLTDWLNSQRTDGGSELANVRNLLEQIRGALDRIDNDSYGICEVCHGEIEKEILECRPDAEICIDCLSDEEKAKLEADLRMAGRIQRALMPQSLPEIPDFSIATKWLPAGEVGGDYYDFLPCGDGMLSRIVIADAMGKGIAGSIVISSLQGAVRVLSPDVHSPGEFLHRLNHWLCRNVPVTRFVSMVCLCLEDTDQEKTRLTYANAGHPLPIIARADGSIEQLEVTGGILGIHEEFDYGQAETSLFKNDLVLLYTDGVTEITNAGGEMYGDNRVIEFVKSHQGEPVDEIIDKFVRELVSFAGSSNRLDDDLTIVCLRKL
jgi:sigma-B regulation protein RsbU (phosphoserine phosphatase)